MPGRTPKLALLVALASLLVCTGSAGAAPVLDGHFPLPPIDASNAKIVAGPDGNMWMPVEDGANDVARIAPDGSVVEFELPNIEDPSGIAVGPEGLLWVTTINNVSSFSPADPKGTEQVFNIPAITAKNPIVAGPDGQMWVAADDNVVHFSPSDPLKAQPISVPKLAPKDIDFAGSLLIVADSGNSRIVTIDSAGTVGEIPLLAGTSTSQGVAGNPNGQFAFSDSDGDEGLSLVTPPNPPTTVVVGEGDPFGVALGSDGAYWFAMAFGKGTIRRLAGDGTATSLSGVPEGFAPRQIAAGPNNTLWMTMEKPGENIYEVARISGLEPPVKTEPTTTAAPETKLKKGPKKFKTKQKKAKVKFFFSSPNAGAKFECALVKKKKGKKKAAKPKFRSCKSPQVYRLKPGAYKFSVRAVLNGIPDQSPATRGFKVVRVPPRATASSS